jgi:transcriptional regulator with XRE-family HTH domain
VNKPIKIPEIRKEAFIKARESLGLSTQELAAKACLSNRQIEQIENGEIAYFYGVQIKYTAAKKVAGILQLTEEQAFDLAPPAPLTKAAALVEETPIVAATQKVKEEAPKVVKPIEQPKPITQKKLALDLQDVVVERGGNQNSKSNFSQKKLMLLISLGAAVVFSVINLRPLFFHEQVKEEVVVIQEPPAAVEPVSPTPVVDEKASSPSPAAIAASSTVTNDCPPADSVLISYKPDAPKKPGDMVYLQSKSAQIVCVIDALGKVQNKQLEPGVGVSIFGKAPLKVLTAGLDQVDMYYQGAKVRPANLNLRTIVLESAEINQPSIPSDSQLR